MYIFWPICLNVLFWPIVIWHFLHWTISGGRWYFCTICSNCFFLNFWKWFSTNSFISFVYNRALQRWVLTEAGGMFNSSDLDNWHWRTFCSTTMKSLFYWSFAQQIKVSNLAFFELNHFYIFFFYWEKCETKINVPTLLKHHVSKMITLLYSQFFCGTI